MNEYKELLMKDNHNPTNGLLDMTDQGKSFFTPVGYLPQLNVPGEM